MGATILTEVGKESIWKRRVLAAATTHTADTSIAGDDSIDRTFNINRILAKFDTAAAGGVTTIDINVNGTSILSTKLTVDAGSKTSKGAATLYVISNPVIPIGGTVTVDIDGIPGTPGKGLTVDLHES